MTDVVANLNEILSEIEKLERAVDRESGSVELVAVSKTYDENHIEPALIAGHRVYGENRVQESMGKWPVLRERYPDIELHLIGPLQSNKAKEAVATFDVIESVDREKIAKALSAEMKKQDRYLPCFVQINTGMEEQKAGIDPEAALAFVDRCKSVHGLNVVGLMCIPPLDENPGPHFALLEKLAAQAKLKNLSMGMSADFVTAIEMGATHIRVGSAIFGERNYSG